MFIEKKCTSNNAWILASFLGSHRVSTATRWPSISFLVLRAKLGKMPQLSTFETSTRRCSRSTLAVLGYVAGLGTRRADNVAKASVVPLTSVTVQSSTSIHLLPIVTIQVVVPHIPRRISPTILIQEIILPHILSLVWIVASMTTIPLPLVIHWSSFNSFWLDSTPKPLFHQILGKLDDFTNSSFPSPSHNILHILWESRNKKLNPLVLWGHHRWTHLRQFSKPGDKPIQVIPLDL